MVDGCEDRGVGSAYIADAFVDFLHGIFVNLRLCVEALEILVDSESLTGFLGHTKIGGVIGRVSPSDNPQFEPFSKRLFNKFLVIWFEGELLVIHWEIVFEVQAVFVLIASAASTGL